jgi:hypothetical protein
MTHVVAFGGGVNSVAMLIRMVQEKMPIDYILFSDTLGEKPETYAYFGIMNTYLREHSYPEITVLPPYRPEGLYGECIRLNRLPSIVYGFKSCSEKWKRRPYLKFLKGKKGIIAYKGFDMDEEHRVKNYDTKAESVRFPLIEWEMDRMDCVKLIIDSGLQLPPKSACFFCPSSHKDEVFDLYKTNPTLFMSAVAMERNAKASLKKILGLGRHFNWEDLVRQTKIEFENRPSPKISCDCAL